MRVRADPVLIVRRRDRKEESVVPSDGQLPSAAEPTYY
jgi:hypothetical protein